MTPERWLQAKEILADARELDANERENYLNQACQGDPDLRLEVDSLLGYEEVEIGILENPVLLRPRSQTSPTAEAASSVLEGQRIGPYRIERELAEGGMGTVFLAVREDDFSKKVALKLVKREKLSEELLSRFHMERQILASLEHPNIASMHDGGITEDGLPYFAMEYVSGEPIDKYCDARKLSIRQRLELFREVCTAVTVAHQSLVIHRDLKPGNILVTSDGVPKLIDFGIAKPLSSELASQCLATATGSRPMTPKYASPEQVRGQQITTATDVYSLGVLLFKLLAGEDPYPLDSPDIMELGRVICDVEPKKPSAIAATRPSAPRKHRRRLAGDLDSIVLKALRKDRHNRYSSVEQFSEDIRRHLVGLPVIAREGTFLYQAGKYLRRNRRPLSVAAVLLVVIVASAMMWLESARRIKFAEQEKRMAVERASEAETALLKSLFKAFKPDEAKGQTPTATQVLERAKERISTELVNKPSLLATQLETIGMVFIDLGHYDEAQPLLEKSLRLRRRFYNGDHPLLARGLHNLAGVFKRTGEYRRAELLYHEALRMRRSLGQEGVDLVKPMNALASILLYQGEYARAEEIYRRGLEIREKTYSREDTDVATSLLSLGTLFYVQGDLERAESFLREALSIRLRALDPGHTKVASAWSTLGRVLLAKGRLEEAEELFTAALEQRQKRLGDEHRDLGFTKKDLAALRLDQGDPIAAERLLTEALRIFHKSMSEETWVIADAESLLGACLAAAGRYEEAKFLLKKSYLTLKESRGEQAIYTRNALHRLQALEAAGQE